MKYYGFDWLAMAASLLAMYLIGNKNRFGFVSFMIANFSWVVIGYWAESPAIILGNIAFFYDEPARFYPLADQPKTVGNQC